MHFGNNKNNHGNLSIRNDTRVLLFYKNILKVKKDNEDKKDKKWNKNIEWQFIIFLSRLLENPVCKLCFAKIIRLEILFWK